MSRITMYASIADYSDQSGVPGQHYVLATVAVSSREQNNSHEVPYEIPFRGHLNSPHLAISKARE